MHMVVVMAVVIKNDRFLAGQRSLDDADWPGKWCLPGGKVEVGETLEQAMRQEVMEEAGVEIKNIFYVGDLINTDSEGIPYIGLIYGCEYESGGVRAGDDMTKMEWLSLDEFGQKEFIRQDDKHIKKALTMYKANEF